MNASELIELKMRGASFERILRAVQEESPCESKLPPEQLDFLQTMLTEAKHAVSQLEQALQRDDLKSIHETSVSMQEIFSMVAESAKQ